MSTWTRCPPPERLAAFADRLLDEPEHRTIEAHVADCDSCLSTLAVLAQHVEVEPVVSPALVARARAFGSPVVARRSPAWAAAAAAVLVGAVAILLTPRGPDRTRADDPGLETREVRATPEMTVAPSVVAPGDEAVLPAAPVRVQWSSVANTAFYEVRIAADDGALVWEARAPGDQSSLVADAPVLPGGRYYVTVTAHGGGDRSVRSRAHGFSIDRRSR